MRTMCRWHVLARPRRRHFVLWHGLRRWRYWPARRADGCLRHLHRLVLDRHLQLWRQRYVRFLLPIECVCVVHVELRSVALAYVRAR